MAQAAKHNKHDSVDDGKHELQCPACAVRLHKDAMKTHLAQHINVEEADMGAWVLERPCAACGKRLPLRELMSHLYTHLGESCPADVQSKTKKKLSVRRKKKDRSPPPGSQ